MRRRYPLIPTFRHLLGTPRFPMRFMRIRGVSNDMVDGRMRHQNGAAVPVVNRDPVVLIVGLGHFTPLLDAVDPLARCEGTPSTRDKGICSCSFVSRRRIRKAARV